jgi:hypothetical protein
MNEAGRQSAWGTMRWLFLVAAAGLIAPLSLFVHERFSVINTTYPTRCVGRRRPAHHAVGLIIGVLCYEKHQGAKAP